MLFFHSLLSKGCILIHPEVADKASLIRLMIDSLAAEGKIDDKDLLFADIMKREELSSTSLDFECAIPHAHSASVKTTVIAAALLREGVDFNAPDGKKARLVFLITGPKNQAGLHLKLLSKMARILHDRNFLKTLMETDSAEDFIGLIKKREE
jgi:fructose-specific phosphotransferase system IIA component